MQQTLNFLIGHLIEMVCIRKSYIVYLEIYVVLIGHGFSFFFGRGKVMENQC